MKTIRNVFGKLMAMVLMLSLFSCSKDSSSPTPTPVPINSGTYTAKIEGTAVNLSTNSFNYTNTTLSLQGANPLNGKSIQIQVVGVTGPGTYALDAADGRTYVGSGTYNPGMGEIGQAYSSIGCDSDLPREGFVPTGTLTVTELTDTKVVGTFQFNAANLNDCGTVRIISEGVFDGKI